MEKLHFGWLTKSPPEYKKQRLFPAKWRKRYFVLYVPPSSACLPGKACTAILDYYSNEKMVKKRGSVDLVKCHSIISNFDSPLYKHMFIMKTVHKDRERDYYLASDSEKEMEDWVNILCDVVGLNKESFHRGTPNRYTGISHFDTQPKPNSVLFPTHPASDYLDLTDCIAGTGNLSPSCLNEPPQIQICRLPAVAERQKTSSDDSSVKTNSNEFPSFGLTDDVYNIPKPFNDEYKMPKVWPNSKGSASSGIDEGFARENYGSPSSSSTSSTAFNEYDFPPPKPHPAPNHKYANSGTNPSNDAKPYVPTSPHEVPLPVKSSKHRKKDGISQNGSSSSSSDAYKRAKIPSNLSPDCSNSSSSSESSCDEIDGDGTPSSIIEGVYSLPRRSSDMGRDHLPSVFEESDLEKSNPGLPPVTKVQYLHLDFSDDPGISGDVSNHKPPSVPTSNKVEYREIDFEKTRALNELRVNREITKSQ